MMISLHLRSLLGAASLGLPLGLLGTDSTTIPELYFTDYEHRDNTDSVAVWDGGDGEPTLLIATTKSTHSLLVFDALNGGLLRRVGGQGILPGQFDRPNGIFVVDDLALVVERDNRRVQVLHLPDFTPLTTFGSGELINPYGLWVDRRGDGLYHVYVSDNYETADEDVPPLADLDERVKVYELEVEGEDWATAEGEFAFAFGDTTSEGAIRVIESLWGDPEHNTLVIAEESLGVQGQVLKVYDLDGNYRGQQFGSGDFSGQAEGLALYDDGQGGGFWIATDQGKVTNTFLLYDRTSFERLGAFSGRYTLNTDGIWLHAAAIGERYPTGLFFAVHNDAAASAFPFEEILALSEVAETD
jgi:3-phytase